MNSYAQIGIIGLGAMGQGLALNIAEKGYRISVFNRHLDGVEENVAQDFVAKSEHRETMGGFDELDSFIQSLAAPRKILLLVSAGWITENLTVNTGMIFTALHYLIALLGTITILAVPAYKRIIKQEAG